MLRNNLFSSGLLAAAMPALLCAALLCSCGSHQSSLDNLSEPADANRPAVEQPAEELPAAGAAAFAQLPAPGSVLADLQAGGQKSGSAVPEARLIDGSGFVPAVLSNLALASGTDARFQPQWTSGTDGLAYALYSFQLNNASLHDSVAAGWEGILPAKTAYIGLSDFTHDRWQWFALPSAGVISPGPLTQFATEEGAVLGVVVVMGNLEQRLHWLRLGANLLPKASLKVTPPIGSVPLSAVLDASESIDPERQIIGYSWDFEGDGVPDASSTIPVVNHTYTESGKFNPTVTIHDAELAPSSDNHPMSVGIPSLGSASLSVNPTSGQAPLPVTLDASANTPPPGASVLAYDWDYDGDGFFDETTAEPLNNHTMLGNSSGIVSVRLRFSDSSSVIASTALDVYGFSTSWGSDNNDHFNALALGSEDEIINAGSTYGFESYALDTLMIKCDSAGKYLWATVWGGGDGEAFYACDSSPDGGILGGGYSYSYAPGGADDALLIKYSALGGVEWTRTWGRDKNDWLQDIAVESNGNIWAAGQTYNPVYNSDKDIMLLMYSPSGELLLQRSYDSHRADRYPYLVLDGAGGVYVGGRSAGNGDGGLDGMLLKVSSSGKLEWQKYYGGIGQDSFGHGRRAEDGSLYFSGFTQSAAGGTDDGLLTRIDVNGELLWARAWGGTDTEALTGVDFDAEGNVFASGYTIDGNGKYSAILLKLSPEGDLIWARQLSEAFYKDFWGCAKQSNDTLVLSGCCSGPEGAWEQVSEPFAGLGFDSGDLEGELAIPEGVTASPLGYSRSVSGIVNSAAGGLDGVLVGYDLTH